MERNHRYRQSLTSNAQISMEDFEDVGTSGLLLDGDLVDVSRKGRQQLILPVSAVTSPRLNAGVVICGQCFKPF
jgi:hypothetical protein